LFVWPLRFRADPQERERREEVERESATSWTVDFRRQNSAVLNMKKSKQKWNQYLNEFCNVEVSTLERVPSSPTVWATSASFIFHQKKIDDVDNMHDVQ